MRIPLIVFLCFTLNFASAQDGYREARKAAQLNDYQTCLKLLNESAEKSDAGYWSLSGACWLSKAIGTEKKAAYDTAIAHLYNAIQLDTADALAYSNLATAIYYKMGREQDKELMETSLAYYDLALESNPYLRLAILNRSILLRNLGYYDESVANINVLIADEPENPIMYLQRARTYAKATAHRTAINDYLKAIDLDSTLAPAYLEAGESYAWLGFYPRAKELQWEAMEIDPKASDRAYFNLARFEVVSGDDELAAKYLKKARKGAYAKTRTCRELVDDWFLLEASENPKWNKQLEKLLAPCAVSD
jgi:tetratricopeptide (TPR) repeat protein